MTHHPPEREEERRLSRPVDRRDSNRRSARSADCRPRDEEIDRDRRGVFSEPESRDQRRRRKRDDRGRDDENQGKRSRGRRSNEASTSRSRSSRRSSDRGTCSPEEWGEPVGPVHFQGDRPPKAAMFDSATLEKQKRRRDASLERRRKAKGKERREEAKRRSLERRRKEFEEKKQIELIRQKMDLDFQSVDTKRSLFISNDRVNSHPPKRKGRPPPQGAPNKRRVSSRPNLDPIFSGQEASLAPRQPKTVYESDEDKSGSTLHSGDAKPKVIRKGSPSVISNDSTLKDIGDIPSEWNLSMMTKSIKSRDSRMTRRSGASRVRSPGKSAKGKQKKLFW